MKLSKKLLTPKGKLAIFAIGLLSYAGHIAVVIHWLHIKEGWLLLTLGVEAFLWFAAALWLLLFDFEDMTTKPYQRTS